MVRRQKVGRSADRGYDNRTVVQGDIGNEINVMIQVEWMQDGGKGKPGIMISESWP